MSSLEAVGSEATQPQEEIQHNPSPSERSVIDTNDSISQINKFISSANPDDQKMALKMLLALMSKGSDVSEFIPYIVQQAASSDILIQHYAVILLNHYSYKDPRGVFLATNSFQKSLQDSDPIVRAMSLKAMTSVHHDENLPVIQAAVNQVSGDTSPYVKKECAYAIIKAAEIDANCIEEFLPILQRLLLDPSPISFSGAIAAYWSICPDNIELLHPIFRPVLQNIHKYDPFAQIHILRSMTVYARYCFKNPTEEDEDETTTAFWDESESNRGLSTDFLLLLHAARQLLQSQNPGVVLAAVSLLFYCAPPSQIQSVAKPLIRLLYDSPLVAEMALSTILTIAASHPHIFIPHLNHFFVRKNDTSGVKTIKLKLLSLITSPANSDIIMEELASYTGSPDTSFAAEAVKTMGKTCLANDAIIPSCLASLLRLLTRAEGQVLAEVVIVLAHLLRRKRGSDDEADALLQLCKKFAVIKEPSARAAVLSIVGDLHETHSEFAPQLLRYIAQNYEDEPGEVRLQSLVLAAKLETLALAKGGEGKSEVPLYLLRRGERDTEYDVRDRARFLLALVEAKSEAIRGKLKELLFPPRKPPTWTAGENVCTEFQIGTFSHYFNRQIEGYDPLPDWADENNLPPDSVRMQTKVEEKDSKKKERSKEKGEEEVTSDLGDFFGDEDKAYYSEVEIVEEEEEIVEEEEVVDEEDDFFGTA